MADTRDDKVKKLKAACDTAYDHNQNSCSHAVCEVIKQYIPTQPYRVANTLIHDLQTSNEWQEVKVHELSKLASEGELVVGGLAEKPHGHVIVVYPGPPKFAGGYYAKNKQSGKNEKVQQLGIYALSMSTSMGGWPGAKNKGEKTVYDPFGGRAKFNKVRFWKYIGNPDDGNNKSAQK